MNRVTGTPINNEDNLDTGRGIEKSGGEGEREMLELERELYLSASQTSMRQRRVEWSLGRM